MSHREQAEVMDIEPASDLQAGTLAHLFAQQVYTMYKALAKYADTGLADLPLSRQTVRLLLLIDANPDVPQGRIAQAMNLERSSIVPVIDRLEHDGYVVRRPNPCDGRSKSLRLTTKGHRQAESLKKLAADAENRMLEGFEDCEKQQLSDLMSRATANLLRLNNKN